MGFDNFFLVESDDELNKSNGKHTSLAAKSATARFAPGKFKRGRTRSTLRNFLGRLGRSNSQDLLQRNISSENVRSNTPVR